MPPKPPPHAARAEQTRAALWRITAAEFAEKGLHDARISDIVRKARVTQPTFYAYFPSKQVAYDTMVGDFQKRLHRLNASLRLFPTDTAERLSGRVAGGLKALLDFLADSRDLTRIGFFQEPAATRTRQILARSIACNIRREQHSGIVRADIPAREIGILYVGIIEHIARTDPGPAQRARQARHCARLLCEGLAPVSPSDA